MKRIYIKFYAIVLFTVFHIAFTNTPKLHDGVFDVSSITEDECVFTDSLITDDFLQNNPNIHSYIWLDEGKKAYVLMKNGDYVFVKKWACLTFGMEAVKITVLPEYSEVNMKYYQQDMLNFGQQFLEKSYYNLYKNVVGNDDWMQAKLLLEVNDKYKINIPGLSYPAYYVTLERNANTIITTIFYYMD